MRNIMARESDDMANRTSAYYVDKNRIVYNAETQCPINKSDLWELYVQANQSITQLAGLLGFPKTGYGRRIVNEVFKQYELSPKKYHHLRIADITEAQARKACSEASSLTQMGEILGAKSKNRANQIGRELVSKFNLSTEHFKWQQTDSLMDIIDSDTAFRLVSDSDTLRELGRNIQELTGLTHDGIFLAHKLLDAYGIDGSKFEQLHTKGLTRDEIMSVYVASSSNGDFLQRLGYSPKSNIAVLWRRFNLPEEGEANWNPAVPGPRPARISIEDWKPTKERLIANRGHKCEKCGCTEWQGYPIPLEVHHINGNHMDDTWDNVQLLCCNCHSQISQKQHRDNRNSKYSQKYTDDDFIQALQTHATIRTALVSLNLSIGKGHYARCYRLILEEKIQPYYDKLVKSEGECETNDA